MVEFEDILPLPGLDEEEAAKPRRQRNKKKFPYHLTGEKAIGMIREADSSSKLKEVKKLEKEACQKSALKKKAQSDRMRKRAEKDGDPMRAPKYRVEAVAKVFGNKVASEVAAGAPIPGSQQPAPRQAPKRKCTERRTTGKRPAAIPRAPKIRRN